MTAVGIACAPEHFQGVRHAAAVTFGPGATLRIAKLETVLARRLLPFVHRGASRRFFLHRYNALGSPPGIVIGASSPVGGLERRKTTVTW